MKRLFNFVLAISFALCSFCVAPLEQDNSVSDLTVYAAYESTNGGTPLDVIEEQIDFAYKQVETYYNPYELPQYSSSYSCGISAGGEIFGFYDRLYEELIPNHQGFTFQNRYFYGTQGEAVQNMYDELYGMMNATSDDVTIPGFIGGVKAYAVSKGRTATLSSAMNNNSLNLEACKTAFKNEKLLSLFVDGFHIIAKYDLEEYENHDHVTINRVVGAHVMIAYGYKVISYYNEQNQCFRTDVYLYVNSGLSHPALGLLRINAYCTRDDAYITEVK